VPSDKIIELHQALVQRGYAVNSWTAPESDEVLVEVPVLKSFIGAGELAELCAEQGMGSGLVVREVMRAMVSAGHFLALVDGSDGFDPTSVEEAVLRRMLWVRTRNVEEAVKSADLLLRDGNLPLVLVQLRGLPLASLRRVPSQHWYRLQRLAKETGTACLLVTPARMIPCARKRWSVGGDFTLNDVERDSAEVLTRLRTELHSRHGGRQVPNLAVEAV
jgi:hypothetical protein